MIAMYKARVASIDGRKVTDDKGNELLLISNIEVSIGSTVYTDGKYIYGYRLPENGAVPYLPAKKKGTLPFYLYDHGFLDKYGLLGILVPSFNEVWATEVPWDTVPQWHGRPAFFNDTEKFFSFRGSWAAPKLYTNGKDEPYNIQADRLLVGNDSNGIFFWQTGNHCVQKSVMLAKQYPNIKYVDYYYDPDVGGYVTEYEKETKNYDVDEASYDDFVFDVPTYSLDGSNHNDLSLVYGKADQDIDTIDVATIVDNILTQAQDILKTYQDAGAGGMDYYYENPPMPTLLDWSIGCDENVYTTNMFDWHYPPCDTNSSVGGNPQQKLDFWQIPEYRNAEYSPNEQAYDAMKFNDECNDYRVIHKPIRLENGDIQFMLTVRGHFVWYPTVDQTYPNKHYKPSASTSNPEAIWRAELVRYTGSWLVTVGATTTMTEYFRGFYSYIMWNLPNDTGYAYTQRHEGGYRTEWRWDAADNTFKGRVKRGNVTIPQEFRNVYAVIPYSDSKVLVLGSMDVDDPDYTADNGRFYTIERDRATLEASALTYVGDNDSYMFVSEYNKLKALYDALVNVPYITNSV